MYLVFSFVLRRRSRTCAHWSWGALRSCSVGSVASRPAGVRQHTTSGSAITPSQVNEGGIEKSLTLKITQERTQPNTAIDRTLITGLFWSWNRKAFDFVGLSWLCMFTSLIALLQNVNIVCLDFRWRASSFRRGRIPWSVYYTIPIGTNLRMGEKSQIVRCYLFGRFFSHEHTWWTSWDKELEHMWPAEWCIFSWKWDHSEVSVCYFI